MQKVFISCLGIRHCFKSTQQSRKLKLNRTKSSYIAGKYRRTLAKSMKTHLLLIALAIVVPIHSKKSSDKDKPKWAQKDIRDFTDADMERLLDQWEEDEDPLPPDELPEYLRPPTPINFEGVDMKDPENMLKVSKKGKTLMTFVMVSGSPSRQESETLTSLWQTSLRNNHLIAERYMVDDNRAIFMFADGSQAWEAKDFLVTQDRCESVTIENKVYNGKGSGKKDEL